MTSIIMTIHRQRKGLWHSVSCLFDIYPISLRTRSTQDSTKTTTQQESMLQNSHCKRTENYSPIDRTQILSTLHRGKSYCSGAKGGFSGRKGRAGIAEIGFPSIDKALQRTGSAQYGIDKLTRLRATLQPQSPSFITLRDWAPVVYWLTVTSRQREAMTLH